MIKSSATPMNRSPTSPTTIPTPNRPIAVAVPEPAPPLDCDVCWSSLTFSPYLALGNVAICLRATGPADAFGDEEDRLCTVVRLAYVKSTIPGFRTANKNSVMWPADELRFSVGDNDDIRFSVDNDDDKVVGFSEYNGANDRIVDVLVGGDDDQEIVFSIVGGKDDKDVTFSVSDGQDVRFSVGGCKNDKDADFSEGGDDDDDENQDVGFLVGGDKDVMPMSSVVSRAVSVVGATAGRVSHRCVMFTVIVEAVVTVIIVVSMHDVVQKIYGKSDGGRFIVTHNII